MARIRGARIRGQKVLMEESATRILDFRRVMAVSTVRPDGWPQTTIVAYANVGLLVYFVISTSSQKFANLQLNNRISIAVGEEPSDPNMLQALYSSAHAEEITDPAELKSALGLLAERHPNLRAYAGTAQPEIAVIRARCEHVSVLDYTNGLGHTFEFVGS